MKKYLSEIGLFIMFLGLHFLPGGDRGVIVSWGELLGIGILLIGLAVSKAGLQS